MHMLILGMSESGKTTLGCILSKSYRDSGKGVIVFDPLNEPKWHTNHIYTDQNQFLDVYWNSRRCMVFIDESGESVGRYNDLMIRTATRGRHWGHTNHYLTQRGTQLSKTVRDQCGAIALFTSSKSDCKTHADEWCCEEMKDGYKLGRGEYLYKTRYTPVQRFKLF
jgi:hypothetical protein